MDWEQFKKDTAYLNRGRTAQERLQLFKSEALRTWNESGVKIKTVITERRVVEAENERDERYRKNMIRFLKDRMDEIEELNEELDNPGMFIDNEEWEKEMGR